MPITRHIDSLLREIMDETEILSLREISGRIYEAHNVNIRDATIETLLNGYEYKFGISPLERIEGKGYKLNGTFYVNPAHHKCK